MCQMPRAYVKYVKSQHNVMEGMSRKKNLQCISLSLTQNAIKGEKGGGGSKLYILSNFQIFWLWDTGVKTMHFSREL